MVFDYYGYRQVLKVVVWGSVLDEKVLLSHL